jgi:hypothetical protein
MSRRKVQRQKAPTAWPYTPEPSPRLGPSALPLDDIKEKLTMDEPTRARPISVARRDGVLSPNRPTLEEVLNNTAPPPYTLAAYTAFLSQQHCLETLEFVTEARKYADKYDEALKEHSAESLNSEDDVGFELVQIWNRLLDVYVKPGAPREINLPAEERDDLVEYPFEPSPAPPAALEPAVKRMYDLMSDSIFIPFCNSLKMLGHAQSYNALSDYNRHSVDLDPSRLTYDERGISARRAMSKRKDSPPSSASSAFSPSRSPASQHRPNHSSSLSSALGRTSAQQRLSTHISHSSAVSESALTDSSEGGASPTPMEQDAVMTPPTTPPTSELGGHVGHAQSAPTTHPTTHPHQLKPHRSESGAWKKTMKFFGGGGSGSGSKKRGD